MVYNNRYKSDTLITGAYITTLKADKNKPKKTTSDEGGKNG